MRKTLALLVVLGCVPEGNSTPTDSGPGPTTNVGAATPALRPSLNVMTAPFEDNFDRPSHPAPIPSALVPPVVSASASGSSSAPPMAALVPPASASGVNPFVDELGPNWHQAGTSVWHIENGQLCVANAHNRGVWLTKVLPINARIEFDAYAHTGDGDLKAEVWGDGQTHAIGSEYNNATSYLAILGGWHNTLHVLARLNEHGADRKVITIDPKSDDPAEKPVAVSQPYHFVIERTDGKTVHFSVNGIHYLKFEDSQPLTGMGHDHFGFNEWEAKVCFDNVKVTPL